MSSLLLRSRRAVLWTCLLAPLAPLLSAQPPATRPDSALAAAGTIPSDRVPALRREAADSLRREQYAEAEVQYRRLLASTPEDATLHGGLGLALLGLGRGGEALAALQHAVDLNPRSAEAWFNLAGALQAGLRFPEAIEAYSRALALQSDWADAYHKRAAARLGAGDLPLAIADYREAVRLDPLSLRWSDLGFALLGAQRRDEAEEAFRSALAKDEQNGRAWFGLSSVFKVRREYTACRDALEKALARLPGNLRIQRDLAFAHLAAEPERGATPALELLREVVKIDAADGHAWHTLGTLHVEARRFDEAASCFEQAVRAGWLVDKSRLLLAETRLRLGEAKAAAELLESLKPVIVDGHALKPRFDLALQQARQKGVTP